MANNSNNENKKKKGFTNWWLSLSKPMKGLLIGATTVGVSSAIVFPTLANTVWKKGGNKPVDPEPIKEWYEDETYINSLTESDIGSEKEVTVNGQVHKVRLIGIDHDDLANGNGKAHTTWEFANLISDSDGNSLAYQWNDTNDTSSANYNYTNSSIRKALCGSGSFTGDVLCAQKGQETWSDTYKNKTILSMLPKGLTNNLKIVEKSVGTTDEYVKTSYTDKLFMLSVREMGYINQYDKGYGETYSYYSGHTEQTDAIRIKKQVNNSEVYTNTPQISSGQVYQGTVDNYAGYNDKTDDTGGGIYWLRSPRSNYSNIALRCDYDGYVSHKIVYSLAYGVAPAFCL